MLQHSTKKKKKKLLILLVNNALKYKFHSEKNDEACLHMPHLRLPWELQCEWVTLAMSLQSHSQFVDRVTVRVSLMPSGLIVKELFLMHESAVTLMSKEI